MNGSNSGTPPCTSLSADLADDAFDMTKIAGVVDAYVYGNREIRCRQLMVDDDRLRELGVRTSTRLLDSMRSRVERQLKSTT